MRAPRGIGRFSRPFANRDDAGRQLAEQLRGLAPERPVVLALPRGGVPVAATIAAALDAPLDVLVVRKLGVPFQPELGMGAIGEDGVRVLNDDVIERAGISAEEIAQVEARERAVVTDRAQRYRAGRPRVEVAGRTVIIVDDGVATGGTARAAVRLAKARGARRVVLAVPVAAPAALADLAADADAIECLLQPDPFVAVGAWYGNFKAVSEEDVAAILASAGRPL